MSYIKSVCFALPIIETAIIILADHSGTLSASLSLHTHMHIHTGVINSQSGSDPSNCTQTPSATPDSQVDYLDCHKGNKMMHVVS